MDILEAMSAIQQVAYLEDISADEVIAEIELAIEEAMQDPDPLVHARWKMIPRSGLRPTALEFVAFMRGIIHGGN